MTNQDRREVAENLRIQIRTAQQTLDNAKSALAKLERECPHDWSDPVYDPIVTPGGYDPGDAPGVGGVDRRLPCSWGSSETPRWKRTCKICGKVEETRQSTDQVKKVPRF